MTIQELVDWCKANDVSLDTQVALRAKSDYLLTEDSLYFDTPYFGNCREGSDWVERNGPRDENGDVDCDNLPNFLIMDTFSG